MELLKQLYKLKYEKDSINSGSVILHLPTNTSPFSCQKVTQKLCAKLFAVWQRNLAGEGAVKH